MKRRIKKKYGSSAYRYCKNANAYVGLRGRDFAWAACHPNLWVRLAKSMSFTDNGKRWVISTIRKSSQDFEVMEGANRYVGTGEVFCDSLEPGKQRRACFTFSQVAALILEQNMALRKIQHRNIVPGGLHEYGKLKE